MAVVAVPAQDPAPPGQGPEFGKASPVALVVILLLALATVFLIRSMTKRIRRLPASFDDPAATGDADGDAAPSSAESDVAEPRGGDRPS